MTHFAEETMSKSERLAERMAVVVHLMVQKIIERNVRQAGRMESTSTSVGDHAIATSRTTDTLNEG
jgi:hypothetical protein